MKEFLAAIVAVILVLGLSTAALATDDDKKITICHNTGSQTNPTVTITVSENAWEAHQKHGDTRGPCPVPSPTATRTASASPTVVPTVSPKPSGSPNATATPNIPARTAAPTGATTTPAPSAKAPVKQLPSTATETSSVPYDPGFDD